MLSSGKAPGLSPSPGIWFHTDHLPARDAAALARSVERHGFSAFWFGEGLGRDPLAHAAYLLSQTERLVIGTGIASIYSRDPQAMMGGANTLAEQSGGRVILGLGVSTPPMVEARGHSFAPPVPAMRSYLRAMQACHYGSCPPPQPVPVVIAALGPQMIKLAGQEALGAYPCNVTPEFTAQARSAMGPDALLGIQQKVVLETSPSRAREIGRAGLALYLAVPHQRKHWERMGFDESDFLNGGSHRLVDGLVAWGNTEAIRASIRAHLDAGANHVCLEPLLPQGEAMPGEELLEALAYSAGV